MPLSPGSIIPLYCDNVWLISSTGEMVVKDEDSEEDHPTHCTNTNSDNTITYNAIVSI